jgi:hypothetical protein
MMAGHQPDHHAGPVHGGDRRHDRRRGLGGEVWRAIQRLEAGRGFEAGLGIVILAIILDRIMQKLGSGRAKSNPLIFNL